MHPQRVADLVFEAIRAEQFYIFTHPEFNPAVQRRVEAILQQHNPSYLE
ncbi:MAG: hypothetical protein JW757_14195 [Anaerolineales bacterium]|nr:hypothetical protein [Anaerolineales bacterium]